VDVSDLRVSRRALLGGATAVLGLLQLGGCRTRTAQPRTPAPDPLEPVLAAAVYLADRYQAAITALPELAAEFTPLMQAHSSHVVALRRELGTAERQAPPSGRPPLAPGSASAPGSAQPGGSPSSPGSVPLPEGRPAILADLRELERTGQQQAAAVCLTGPGYHAALLGSIAAARATHAEVLT